jgi:hypothetical protein
MLPSAFGSEHAAWTVRNEQCAPPRHPFLRMEYAPVCMMHESDQSMAATTETVYAVTHPRALFWKLRAESRQDVGFRQTKL